MGNSKFPKNYLGLDIGTDYLGYAVSDENYKLVKVHGRGALGVVNFEEAKTAAERRSKRTAERRLARREQRINLLQELFATEIAKVDPNFLPRLNENDLVAEDRAIKGKFSLFNDPKFTDVQYHKKYPTIYHLRSAAMKGEIDDIRLLYLAVHHIIKYRGHFLIDGEVAGAENLDLLAPVEELNQVIQIRNSNLYDEEIEDANTFDVLSIDRLDEIKPLLKGELKNANGYPIRGKKETKARLYEILGVSSKQGKILADALIDGETEYSKLFGAENYEKGEGTKVDFGTYEENIGTHSSALAPDDFAVLDALKRLYDRFILIKLLAGFSSLSEAMIDKYRRHGEDLKVLKRVIKAGGQKLYKEMFEDVNDEKKCNYVAYIGGGRVGSDKLTASKCTDPKEFYKYVKKALESVTAPEVQEEKESILCSIESGDFLPRIVSKANSTLPYQLNKNELEKILVKAEESGKFEFLKACSDGWTVHKKIVSLLTFRIPYYVGPLSEEEKTAGGAEVKARHWAVRNDTGRITPWNFDVKIDKRESGRKFIERMTTGCTYLKKPRALPKNSLTYERYNALNELNGLKLNGLKFPVDIKQKVFDNVYLNGKVSVKAIERYLRTIGDGDIRITGYDKELKGDMPVYRSLAFLGDKRDKYVKELDDVIKICTIHEEKKLRKEYIEEHYGEKGRNIFTPEEIDKLASKHYSGWGRLSAEFLRGSLYGEDGLTLEVNGQRKDIVDLLYETDQNMMEIIHDKRYGFNSAIREYLGRTNQVDTDDVTYKDVEDMYCSPSVKRALWQTFRVVKEVVEETKEFPQKIFIEVTRHDDEKKKGKAELSRKEKLEALYKEADKATRDLDKDMRERMRRDIDSARNKLNEFSDNSALRKEKMYLYFIQLGRDAYTGREIYLSELNDYDIDHIYPQSKIKDDSIDNKVLTRKKDNGEKSDVYPIPAEYRKAGKNWWRAWFKLGLISKEKFDRLMRSTPLSPEEQQKFINRQLVETSQVAKCLRDLLEKWIAHKKAVGELHKDANIEIDFVKGKSVSAFRKQFGLTKSRDVNDFHHAYDAYMNIVAGNVLYEYFNHNIDYTSTTEDSLNPEKLFYRYVKSHRTDGYVWVPERKNSGDEPTIKVVRKMLETVPHFARQTVRGRGKLYKETIYKASDGNALYPIKEKGPKSDMSKYGGCISSGTAYFVVVDSEGKKGALKRSIEPVTIYHDKKIHSGRMSIGEYLRDVRGLKNPSLANIEGLKDSVILPYSLVRIDGDYYVRISGYTGSSLCLNNATQLFVDNEINNYVKELRIITEKVTKQAGSAKADVKEALQENTCAELIAENQRRLADPTVNHKERIVIVDKEKNLKLYDFFVEKLSVKPFANISGYSSLMDNLKLARDAFIALSLYKQITTLQNIMCAFQCNAKSVDISSLVYANAKGVVKPGGSRLATSLLNMDISNKQIELITQSRSGLREKRIQIGVKNGISDSSN